MLLLANIYLNYFDTLWEKYGAELGELTRYADDLVAICKTKKDAIRALQLIQQIMQRLELTVPPTKTKLVGLWTGEEGFDFLGMHHRRTKAETSQGRVYYTTQQWPAKKAEQHIRDVIKERLAPPSARVLSLESHIEYLNPKIRGWKNYYGTPYSTRIMSKLDWYILQRFARSPAPNRDCTAQMDIFDTVTKRGMGVEMTDRVAALEVGQARIGERVENLEERFESHEKKQNGSLDKLDHRLAAISGNFMRGPHGRFPLP